MCSQKVTPAEEILREGGGSGRATGSPLSPVGTQLCLWNMDDDLRREGSAVHDQDQAVGRKRGGRGANKKGSLRPESVPVAPSTNPDDAKRRGGG